VSEPSVKSVFRFFSRWFSVFFSSFFALVVVIWCFWGRARLCRPPVALEGGAGGGLVLGGGGCGVDPLQDDEGQAAEHHHDPADEEDGCLEGKRERERHRDEYLFLDA